MKVKHNYKAAPLKERFSVSLEMVHNRFFQTDYIFFGNHLTIERLYAIILTSNKTIGDKE